MNRPYTPDEDGLDKVGDETPRTLVEEGTFSAAGLPPDSPFRTDNIPVAAPAPQRDMGEFVDRTPRNK